MAENSESINELKTEIAGSRERLSRELQTGLAMAAIKLVGNLARPLVMEFVKNRFFYSGEPSRGRK